MASSKNKGRVSLDERFYLSADKFFLANAGLGLTYDDVSLATRYSEVLPRMTRLDSSLSDALTLSLPILSSDMDTVTEHRMAIAMALNGGLGLLHYNMKQEEQVAEVRRVKNHIHGMIGDPAVVSPEHTIAEVLLRIEADGLAFSTFPVVGRDNTLLGLLPGSAVKERHGQRKVAEVMIPRDKVFSVFEKDLGKDPIAKADRLFSEHVGQNKLLVVDAKNRLRGLFTLSDIERISEESRAHVRPTRDSDFRLRVGVAVSLPRTPEGEIDRERFLAHTAALVAELQLKDLGRSADYYRRAAEARAAPWFAARFAAANLWKEGRRREAYDWYRAHWLKVLSRAEDGSPDDLKELRDMEHELRLPLLQRLPLQSWEVAQPGFAPRTGEGVSAPTPVGGQSRK